MRSVRVAALLAVTVISPVTMAQAQSECASVTVVAQNSVPDSAGNGSTCSAAFCLQPPLYGYEYPTTYFRVRTYLPGWAPTNIVAISTPTGWQAHLGATTVIWTGPYIWEPACGFSISVHVPESATGFLGAWEFALAGDWSCGDVFSVICQPPTRSEPSTWGQIKALFR